ncbi:MAG TPA: hypothetical protein VL485_32140 [Ktedonobacteraceae bacterium]|nr:hypothetical protein [Ktedonobacteraceae bacterium]
MQLLKRRNRHNAHTLNAADTDPGLPRITLPIPTYQFSNMREPWHRRLASGLHNALVFMVRKIIQLLNFALCLLLLLLFARFLLIAFSLHASIFASWIFQLSAWPVLPFNNLLPMLSYQGWLIDMNTLVAILSYTIVFKLITGFLHNLFIPAKKSY